MLLKINNVAPSSSYLRIDSGRGYDFLWDNKHQGFIYAPKSQVEIDEIYQAIASYGSPWVIVPVLEAAAAPVAAVALPPDEREAQAAFVTGLQRDIDTASALIGKLRAENKDKDGTIAMLRADLAAQQEKAAAAAQADKPAPAPKAKPGRKAQPIPVEDVSDIPTD
jgi:hypothetical protein